MGLLDALSDPQNALAIGLLGAASSGKGFGGGLLDAVNYANSVKQHNEDRDLQKQYRNAQIQELQRKSLADARQQALMADFFGLPPAGAATGGAAAKPPALGLLGPTASGMPMVDGETPQSQSDGSPGRYAIARADGGVSAVPQRALGGNGMASAPMPGMSQQPAQGAGGRLAKIAADYGLPIEALQADMLFNGGKKIAELVSSAAKPNWMNINNNLVNTNAPGFKGGFQPGYTTSANGVTTMQMPDGRGGIQTVIPPGALEAYRQFQGVGADLKPIKIYNPETGREEYTSEGNVVRGARGTAAGAGGASSATNGGRPSDIPPPYNGGSPQSAAAEQIAVMQDELRKLPQGHPARAGITREIARLQGFGPRGEQAPQSGNYAAGPSAAESIANEAARVKAVKQTEADITPTAQKIGSVDTARDALSVIDQALNHPGLKTATGLSGSLDPRNYIAGTDATNFRVLVDQIKGGVFLDAYKDLRGAGQITEVEGQKAEAAKARINRAQSPDEFVKGLQEYRAIVDRGYERARRNLPAGSSGASGSWDEPAGGQQASSPRATMRYNPQTGRLEKVN